MTDFPPGYKLREESASSVQVGCIVSENKMGKETGWCGEATLAQNWQFAVILIVVVVVKVDQSQRPKLDSSTSPANASCCNYLLTVVRKSLIALYSRDKFD